jgi:Fe-S-cluster containining protein
MSHVSCRRCGVCCTKGGPALHAEDAALFSADRLSVQDLFCVRRGELAQDPRRGEVWPVDHDLIKIRGRHPSWACVFYAEHAECAIYDSRPAECRALSCDDPRALFAVMDTPYLSRWDLVDRACALGGCIAEHEALFPVAPALALAQTWKAGADGAILAELTDMVRREWYFRRAFTERVRIADEDAWPFFGRPLWMVLAPLVPFVAECVSR